MVPTYEATENFRGDARRVMDCLATSLTAAAFRIESAGESTLLAIAPRMYNTRQNPLLGASRIELRVAGSSLSARAELGGVAWLMRLVGIILIGVAMLELPLAFLLPGWGKITIPLRLLIMEGPLLPWIVLLPLMGGWMRGRARKAVDALLHNATIMASR